MPIAKNSTRVTSQTDHEINRRIRLVTIANIERVSSNPQRIQRRLNELDHEWDIERTLQTNAATLALTGLVFGLSGKKRYLCFSAGVLSFLLQHSLQGWCPPLPILRRLGFRTAEEINQERLALRLLRGDFADVKNSKSGAPELESVLAKAGLEKV